MLALRGTSTEWSASLHQSISGGPFLIPVVVQDVDLPPLLSRLIYIDLRGLGESEAKEVLLRNLRNPRQEPPGLPPPFPGVSADSDSRRPPRPDSREARVRRMSRPSIFVSYSHKDKRWLERLQTHLRPLERDRSIDVWSDLMIKPGDGWEDEIRSAIGRAGVAILLVSANFLASDFAMEEEVPRLLRSAEENGAIIMPLIVGPSLFSKSSLASFQAVNSPQSPLSKLTSYQRDEVFVRLASAIQDAFS